MPGRSVENETGLDGTKTNDFRRQGVIRFCEILGSIMPDQPTKAIQTSPGFNVRCANAGCGPPRCRKPRRHNSYGQNFFAKPLFPRVLRISIRRRVSVSMSLGQSKFT